MDPLADALREAGGLAAPRERTAQLRALLEAELVRSATELAAPRSGYPDPVSLAVAPTPAATAGLVCVLPVPAVVRADLDATEARAWLLVGAAVGALVDAGCAGPPEVGELGGHLALRLAAAPGGPPAEADLATLAFEEHVAAVDRLRARAVAVPDHVLEAATDFRVPLAAHHPITIAFHVAALGGRPADPDASDAHEEALAARLGSQGAQAQRPHDDPDPDRRVARRILQRLDGMGKWGGYHTEFAHLSRGFAPGDRARAAAVGERLLEAGLLCEKPSVGQRHVYLNPRRVADIRAAIDDGRLPAALRTPAT